MIRGWTQPARLTRLLTLSLSGPASLPRPCCRPGPRRAETGCWPCQKCLANHATAIGIGPASEQLPRRDMCQSGSDPANAGPPAQTGRPIKRQTTDLQRSRQKRSLTRICETMGPLKDNEVKDRHRPKHVSQPVPELHHALALTWIGLWDHNTLPGGCRRSQPARNTDRDSQGGLVDRRSVMPAHPKSLDQP